MAKETNPTPQPRKRSRAKKAAPPETKAPTPEAAPTPPAAPGKARRAWAFINTNSAVLDLMVNTLTFLIVACFGTWLVFKQNNLMESQNALVKQQMSLDEAGRRSALIALMSNIMDKVDDEIKDQKDDLLKKGLSRAAVDTMKFSLSQSLIGQIAALSHSFKPYRYLDADTLIDKPLSPERGQLLITLTRLPLDARTLHNIYQSAVFSSADLRGAILKHSDLRKAMLNESNLKDANLFDADLREANFFRANMIGVSLFGANLYRSTLRESNLRGSNLLSANLKEANLIQANLNQATLWNTNLCGVGFYGATLWNADINEADLQSSDLTLKQAQTLKSLINCKNLHDSLSIPLHQTHPHLFEWPKD